MTILLGIDVGSILLLAIILLLIRLKGSGELYEKKGILIMCVQSLSIIIIVVTACIILQGIREIFELLKWIML